VVGVDEGSGNVRWGVFVGARRFARGEGGARKCAKGSAVSLPVWPLFILSLLTEVEDGQQSELKLAEIKVEENECDCFHNCACRLRFSER
jgi:hypothetical protein